MYNRPETGYADKTLLSLLSGLIHICNDKNKSIYTLLKHCKTARHIIFYILMRALTQEREKWLPDS